MNQRDREKSTNSAQQYRFREYVVTQCKARHRTQEANPLEDFPVVGVVAREKRQISTGVQGSNTLQLRWKAPFAENRFYWHTCALYKQGCKYTWLNMQPICSLHDTSHDHTAV